MLTTKGVFLCYIFYLVVCHAFGIFIQADLTGNFFMFCMVASITTDTKISMNILSAKVLRFLLFNFRALQIIDILMSGSRSKFVGVMLHF